MSETMNAPRNSACPRCRSVTVEVRSTSPVAGAWTVFGCNTCFYTWRSTEPGENTDPQQYPKVFQLKPEDLGNLPVVPRIAPRRRRGGPPAG